jgi:hypothetical protein
MSDGRQAADGINVALDHLPISALLIAYDRMIAKRRETGFQ